MGLFVIKSYAAYNSRRYGMPWAAKVGKTARIDFSEKISGYTGGWGTGDAGDLYIENPEEGQIYAWGQKDYRNRTGSTCYYGIYQNGALTEIAKTDLVKAVNAMVAAKQAVVCK